MADRFLRTRVMFRVIWELLRYEAVYPAFGLRGVCRAQRLRGLFQRLRKPRQEGTSAWAVRRQKLIGLVPKVVSATASFHWKPILCLQRAVVTARVLRSYGTDAEIVIGGDVAPFFGHAWVEVDGRVINDSRGYKQKLQILARY